MLTRVASVVVLVVLLGACSGDEPADLLAPTTSTATSTSEPPSLAFADDEIPDSTLAVELEPRTLAISVPTFAFRSPAEVDESDPVEVFVTDLLTDGLTQRDAQTGEIVPALADVWSASPDRRTWTFSLGANRFSDGAPVTAADAEASLERVAALGGDSITGPHLGSIDGWTEPAADGDVRGIRAIDERTLEIELTTPLEDLPALLASVAFGVLPEVTPEQGALPLSSSMTLTPTALWEDGFRLEAAEPLGLVNAVEVLMDPELTMLEVGETGVAIGFEADEVPESIKTSASPSTARVFFAMNHAAAPFDDPNLRAAVVAAIDTRSVVDEFFPMSGPMTSFLTRGDGCGFDCFDPALAERLVADSPAGQTPFSVDYFVVDGDDREQRLAETIVSQLRTVGFVATARAHPIEDYGRQIDAGNMGLFRFGTAGGAISPERTLAGAFGSDGVDNVSAFSDPLLDSAIGDARSIIDDRARLGAWENIDTTVLDADAVLSIAELRTPIAFGDRVEFVGLEPDGSLDLASISWLE